MPPDCIKRKASKVPADCCEAAMGFGVCMSSARKIGGT